MNKQNFILKIKIVEEVTRIVFWKVTRVTI